MTAAWVLRHSEVESRRFGLDIARGVAAATAAPGQILEDIRSLRPELAIFRCPAGDTAQIAALADAGLSPLHADTLVYYRIALDLPGVRNAMAQETTVVAARNEDEQALAAIVRRSFRDYRNHYHANPRLSPDAILEGYVEWALDYAIRPVEGQQTWVVRSDGQARCFATCRLKPGRSEVEIVLNATDPEWAGRGFYSSLLQYLIGHYGDAGLSSLVVSTQVWNYGVQRVWARTGLVIDHAWDTYHINIPHSFFEADCPCP